MQHLLCQHRASSSCVEDECDVGEQAFVHKKLWLCLTLMSTCVMSIFVLFSTMLLQPTCSISSISRLLMIDGRTSSRLSPLNLEMAKLMSQNSNTIVYRESMFKKNSTMMHHCCAASSGCSGWMLVGKCCGDCCSTWLGC